MDDFARWIADNNGLLSGLVSLIALVGLVLSPLGKGVRRLSGRGGQAGESPRPESSAASAPSAAEPLLAVLAFDNLSSDGEMQFFSDGISEEIIQRLSRGAKLRVIGRTSSFEFRGERKAEAARILACTHVLDGSIRRSGERVRITAHLVEASSRTTLWSERYDRGLEDIFAVQDEISESIAAALDRAFASSSTPDVDPAVYDVYLRARPASFAPDELRRHIDSLEEVTRSAPEFGDSEWRDDEQPPISAAASFGSSPSARSASSVTRAAIASSRAACPSSSPSGIRHTSGSTRGGAASTRTSRRRGVSTSRASSTPRTWDSWTRRTAPPTPRGWGRSAAPTT